MVRPPPGSSADALASVSSRPPEGFVALPPPSFPPEAATSTATRSRSPTAPAATSTPRRRCSARSRRSASWRARESSGAASPCSGSIDGSSTPRIVPHMALEFAARIDRIPVYPAAAGYSLGPDVALLASNESPFAPLPEVIEAAHRALGGLNRYPDPSYAALRRALSDRYGVPGSRIAIGNGSCDVLLAAGEALLEPGAEVVYAWPSFSVYPHLAAASGARAIEVPLDAGHRHDLDAMRAEVTVATRLVIVCNPNNPTSTALPLDQIAEFVASVPRHVAVILDEAYCEFALSL